jgi:MoxR-like ATPase
MTTAQSVTLESIRPALGEMHDAVTKTIQLFLDKCPEGFKADDVAEAIVDVCSDEMLDLYRARAQRDELTAEVTRLRAELADSQARLAEALEDLAEVDELDLDELRDNARSPEYCLSCLRSTCPGCTAAAPTAALEG